MKHLLFDADMTIWDFDKTEELSMKALFDHYHIPYDEETLDAYRIGNGWCWKEFEEDRMTLETLEPTRWRLLFERIGREDIDPVEAAALYSDLLGANGILLPGAREFLEATQDLERSMVTNGLKAVQRARLRDTDTEKYFSHIFISQEIGPNKPKKEFFDIVLSTLGLRPEDCIMIGDSETSDIRGALNAGIESVYLNFQGRKSTLADHSVASYGELETLLRSIV